MDSETRTFSDIMQNPDRDYCKEKIRDLAAELFAQGHKPRTIANELVGAAISVSWEDGWIDHKYFMQMLERLGRDGLTAVEQAMDRAIEIQKATGLPKH